MSNSKNRQQQESAGHVDSAKYVSVGPGQKLTTDYLAHQFPNLTFVGEVQQTGLLGRNRMTGDYEVFVRHPWWVPVKQTDGSISYGAGGKQTNDHVIYLLGRRYGKKAQDVAGEVTDALKKGNEIPHNALTIGKEAESIAHDARDGTIVRLGSHEQFEFQAGIHEDALPPFQNLSDAIAARIQQLAQRERHHPGLLLMDSSSPLAGSPNDPGMQLNNGDGGNYIRPWSEYLKQHLVFTDRKTTRLLNAIAKAHGYVGYKKLIADKGFQVLWPTASCQTSIGMPHLREADGSYTIPLEIAIATADVFNSHIGAIADLLMASSPFLFGVSVSPLRDHRIALRHIFDGALPGSFIGNTSGLSKRWEYGGVSGMLYTLDRLAFQTKRAGRAPHAMIYGSARVRVETKDTQVQLGRVENTIAGSSPSLLDEIAHDAFIYLLTVAAHEAVAHGKTPAQYFGERYPHIKRWRQRKIITESFNIHGAQHPDVVNLLSDGLGLLEYIRDNYLSLRAMTTFVITRIKNLQVAPVSNMEEYRYRPQGPISEVMMAMHSNGATPLEIMKEVYEYQHWLAREIKPYTQSLLFFEDLNTYITDKFH